MAFPNGKAATKKVTDKRFEILSLHPRWRNVWNSTGHKINILTAFNHQRKCEINSDSFCNRCINLMDSLAAEIIP